MGPLTGIAAGFAAALGAMALYRALERRLRAAKKTVDDLRGVDARSVIDFELDTATGVYRTK